MSYCSRSDDGSQTQDCEIGRLFILYEYIRFEYLHDRGRILQPISFILFWYKTFVVAVKFRSFFGQSLPSYKFVQTFNTSLYKQTSAKISYHYKIVAISISAYLNMKWINPTISKWQILHYSVLLSQANENTVIKLLSTST